MSERMIVDFTPGEGTVLRMLGLIERRGFRVRGIGMNEKSCGRRALLMLDLVPLDSGRSLDVLGLQLRRLHEVNDVARPYYAQGAAA